MGVNDRDYWRDVPIYRRLIGRDGSPPLPPPSDTSTFAVPLPLPRRRRRQTQTRPWAWILVGAIAVLAVIAFAASHRPAANGLGFVPVRVPSAPIVPSVPVVPSPPAAESLPINGPTHVTAGSVMTVTGTLPVDVAGVVVVEAQWGNGGWVTLATTQSSAGGYRVRYELARPGTVHLKIELPNGNDAVSTIVVS
jgi:hypothetical protein